MLSYELGKIFEQIASFLQELSMCVFVSMRKWKHTVCGGGCATAAACRDLMLMRSVMGENREREGNRLGLHWQAHFPYALQ